jgi:hypothetical protein
MISRCFFPDSPRAGKYFNFQSGPRQFFLQCFGVAFVGIYAGIVTYWILLMCQVDTSPKTLPPRLYTPRDTSDARFLYLTFQHWAINSEFKLPDPQSQAINSWPPDPQSQAINSWPPDPQSQAINSWLPDPQSHDINSWPSDHNEVFLVSKTQTLDPRP